MKTLVLVKKVSQFLGLKEVYLVGDIKEGELCKGMIFDLNGKQGKVLEVESKNGNRALPGVLAGVTVRGVNKDDFKRGEALWFSLPH